MKTRVKPKPKAEPKPSPVWVYMRCTQGGQELIGLFATKKSAVDYATLYDVIPASEDKDENEHYKQVRNDFNVVSWAARSGDYLTIQLRQVDP